MKVFKYSHDIKEEVMSSGRAGGLENCEPLEAD